MLSLSGIKALTKLLFAKSLVGSLFAVALMAWSPLQTRADVIAFNASSTGTQLVKTTIPAGTGGTLIDGFRYVSIAPFTLPAVTYTIGGFYGSDSDFSLIAASIAA